MLINAFIYDDLILLLCIEITNIIDHYKNKLYSCFCSNPQNLHSRIYYTQRMEFQIECTSNLSCGIATSTKS